MSAGWISMNKNAEGGPRVFRKVCQCFYYLWCNVMQYHQVVIIIVVWFTIISWIACVSVLCFVICRLRPLMTSFNSYVRRYKAWTLMMYQINKNQTSRRGSWFKKSEFCLKIHKKSRFILPLFLKFPTQCNDFFSQYVVIT